MKMDKASFIYQIFSTFLTRIILLLGGFIASVLTARILGPEGKGILTAVFVIPTLVVTLADLGIRQASAYYIGKKEHSTEDVASTLYLLWLVTSCLSLLIVGLIYWLQFGDKYGWAIFIIVMLTIPLNLAVQYTKGIMQGKTRIGSINTSELIKVGLNIAFMVLLVLVFRMNVIGAALTQLLLALFAWAYSMRVVRKDTAVRLKYVPGLPMLLIRKGIAYAVALFVLQLNYRIAVVFLEHYTTASEVGIFSVGTNLAELIWQVPAAVGMVIFARSANSKTDAEAVQRSVAFLKYLMPLLLAGGVVFWLVCPWMVSLLYGAEFASSALIIRYLLPGILMMVIFKVLNADMAGRGFPLYALWVATAPLVLNVVLNFLLIPQYGGSGAAAASSISYTLSGILYLIVYCRKENVQLKVFFSYQLSDMKAITGRLSRKRQTAAAGK
ncbi:oligosaccharide flippase family protein [Paenibacillus oenotherae]|uniref:Oligosaccharide flippase family protein n=1 Tax=Paenibacillus oenotherae TaxID=1435645 RepID=A0ABS7D9V8_9BACL|nr:oligosaccharide flippase family protein [Paenibacillus oenotherae]MBW7476729.1 oligosaccharide flippase family protein [Paenibacillus oenotherae]